jgi:Carboxypeptidase regulatory-like domain/TonB dependent receptor
MNSHSIGKLIRLSSFIVVLFAAVSLSAQTFRGALNGTVTDQSGALVPNAQVEIVQAGTGTSFKALTSSAGEFTFLDLPIGKYDVNVSASGFKPEQVKGVPVSAGTTYTLPIKIGVASAGETVEVAADALALDTTSTVATTDIPSETVQNTPMNGRDFTQMIAMTPGYAGYSGGGGGSVNGARPDMINWQIEGADNNDIWWNVPAANQGGVSGIAGVVLPLDAIEQVSTVTQAGPDIGRSPGATVNLSIKSGSNALHGSAYYYNRNEALAAQSQLAVTKPELRNQHFGYSAGGPIWKDHLFFFTTYEDQRFTIGVGEPSTEPSYAYVCGSASCSPTAVSASGGALYILQQYGVATSQTALNLLYGSGSNQGLWPASSLTGSAQPFNYTNPANESGASHNGLAKIDYSITDKDKLSFNWFIGQGPQVAPTVSLLSPYYEEAPIHVQNYSLTYNRVLSSTMTNQIFAGVNYFQQSFYDQSTNYDPVELGLNTGVTNPNLGGAPRIQIASPQAESGLGSSSDGFDYVGNIPASGRQDITGHLDESFSWTVGKHELHLGGEFRKTQVFDFYQADQRGTFNFDGTQGPWSGNSGTACDSLSTATPSSTALTNIANNYTADPRYFQLADFLAGCYDASDTTIVQGDPKRLIYLNSYGIFGGDTFQFSHNLTFNYGVRYEYEGPIHDPNKDMSVFLPGATNGLAVAGSSGYANLYPQYHSGWGPRVGIIWQPSGSEKTVVRAGYGLGYDNPNIVNFLNSRFSSNGGAFGVEDNPAGDNIAVDTTPSAPVIPSGANYGTDIFPNAFTTQQQCLASPSALQPQYGCSTINVFSISQHLRPGYVENMSLNVEQSLGKGLIAQVGYVGSFGHRLRTLLDINQAALNSANIAVPYSSTTCPAASSGATPSTPGNDQQCSRPYYSAYPNYGVINQIQSAGNSNYNSLQAVLRTSKWRGITSQVAYTHSHSLDEFSQLTLWNPQNSFCLKCEYSNSDFDVHNTLVTYASYELPKFGGPKVLTNGWQVNGLLNLHGGPPFTIFSSNAGGSGTGEFAERANEVPGVNPNAGISKAVKGSSATGFYVNWTPTSFTPSVTGQFGDGPRNDLHGPGYSDFDLSLFKNTQIGERVTAQFRVEMFNVFNRLNLAAPGDGYCTDTNDGANPTSCAIGTTIGANYGAPGIGAGEPYNTQLALKIIF